MPTLRPDDTLVEFAFTEQELQIARTLTPLQAQYFQTLYARKFKEKAAEMIPTEGGSMDDRKYLLFMGACEGYLDCLQELIIGSMEAMKEKASEDKGIVDSESEIDDVSKRASAQVNT